MFHQPFKHSAFPTLFTFALIYSFSECGTITDDYLILLSSMLREATLQFKFQLLDMTWITASYLEGIFPKSNSENAWPEFYQGSFQPQLDFMHCVQRESWRYCTVGSFASSQLQGLILHSFTGFLQCPLPLSPPNIITLTHCHSN